MEYKFPLKINNTIQMKIIDNQQVSMKIQNTEQPQIQIKAVNIETNNDKINIKNQNDKTIQMQVVDDKQISMQVHNNEQPEMNIENVAIYHGFDGKNLEYNWDGTKLGIKREDEKQYKYSNLQGIQGIQGVGITNGYINENNHFIVNLSNNVEFDSGEIKRNITTFNWFGTFQLVGVIGDELSVGAMQILEDSELIDRNLPYSWVEYMQKDIGTDIIHLGCTGCSAKSWFTYSSAYEMPYKDDKKASYCYNSFNVTGNKCQAYIIMLGINDGDINNQVSVSLGNSSDIDDNENINVDIDSFYYWYAKIIQNIKLLNNKAKIFVVTIPESISEDREDYNVAIRYMANKYNNVYLVDMANKYNDLWNYDMLNKCKGYKYYNPLGYRIIANIFEQALSDCMKDNYEEFKDIYTIPYDTWTNLKIRV